jgi:TolB-like protein/class 3 adenylate cyclase/Flp pilus assembly protein TadD
MNNNITAIVDAAPTATMPSGTVTFLFTDIEGSTRLWEEYADLMRVALARHDVLLREAIGKHRGYIFKTGGDAFYAAFGTAPDGVAATLAAQQALAAESWPGGAVIRVRMGVHTGIAELRDSDYFGPALNRVARMMNAGHGGQTLVSVAAREACGEALPDGASLTSLGEFTFKDLPQPQVVYQLLHQSLRSTFPPLRTVAAQETVPSIAVLPFVNMSGDEESEYFADGLSEELLNVLAKIKGLRVASRTSARTFKGKEVDMPTVAQQLQVANVLAGSVRKAGKRARISTQLVDGPKDATLWSERYDRELDDIFAVQDDIAQSVVQELRERLLGKPVEGAEAAKVIAEVQAASKGRTENPEAFRLYLQGNFFRDKLTQESSTRAVECYEEALKLDPEYAMAWAGLSRATSDLAGQNWIPRVEGYERARTAAQRAVTLEPTLPEAHTALGWVLGWYDWNWKAAETSFNRALELAPGSTLAINGAATFFGNLGNLEEAIGLFRRAVQLDPLNVPINRNLGLYCLAAGALQEAKAALTNTLHLAPRSGMTYCWRSFVRLGQGRLDEALEDAEKEVSPIFKLVGTAIVQHARGDIAASDAALEALITEFGADSPYQVAEVYGARGEVDKAFEWLEKTYTDRDPGLSYMKMDPSLAKLRSDPRYQPLLEKIGLAD